MGSCGDGEIAAFEWSQDDEGEGRWRPMEKPPCLISCGANDFVEEPRGRGERAYVDGYRVAGLVLLRPGRCVLVRRASGLTLYRYGGRAAKPEPAGGRICALSRTPIEGPAIRCSSAGCGAVMAQSAAEEAGSCPACGKPLRAGEAACPEEEALS